MHSHRTERPLLMAVFGVTTSPRKDLVLGVLSISILSRDPNLSRTPPETGENGSGCWKERGLKKRVEKESTPRLVETRGFPLRLFAQGGRGSDPLII